MNKSQQKALSKARKEARKLYEGKFFYEIVKTTKSKVLKLVGPFDNIFYTVKKNTVGSNFENYKFVQVINGMPVQAFTEDQILVTDRKL